MQALIGELKRRNIFRVGAAYAVVGWFLVQMTARAVPAFAMPDWISTAVFYFTVIGFPITLMLAWSYDRIGKGVRRSDVSAAERTKGSFRWVDVTLMSLLFLIGFLTLYQVAKSLPD